MTGKIQAQKQRNQLPTELADRFLSNQSKELDIKSREIDLQNISDQHNFDYSKEALKKEADDREAHRIFIRKSRRDTYIFSFLLFLSVVILLMYALSLGKDVIVMEVIKAAIFFVTGGAGGYAYGYRKKNSD